ncbi:hypothetical protein ES319_A08G158400v1 [Gossypium barbadense]|uniref:Uncharacterized protein n=3 Tax=Gossypium TaxID=3633 RepID=A0A5J5USJ6_GOSBA|nr:hypothetical protein ES319_A08G158400v1 [Gossypium barbadense]TYH06693.1 hypothetical protein ES288_A08G174200v1 [Gossypium darwinii]TYI15271.1 hypothetical protein ES332_A08G175100v1 [Gossypium tomentosum]
MMFCTWVILLLLLFFRMRLEILMKKNKTFKFLRIYNFVVIVHFFAYQSPFVGEFSSRKFKTVSYTYEVIGFYKYDYGLRIAARSALVEIVIFMFVSLQSYMFSSHKSDYVSRYLEVEQIGAIVHEQEKKATWKLHNYNKFVTKRKALFGSKNKLINKIQLSPLKHMHMLLI